MTETRSVVIERDMPHPPEKVWRALTTQPLIEDWLSYAIVPLLGYVVIVATSIALPAAPAGALFALAGAADSVSL